LAALAVAGLAAFLSSAVVQGGRGAEPGEAARATEAAAGQEVEEGGLAFSVAGLECKGKELTSVGVATKALGRFCLLRLKVRNAGNQPVMYFNGIQVVLDSQGRRYDVAQAATEMVSRPGTAQADRSSAVQQMNPGTELQRLLAFDVPEGVTPAVAEFHSRPRSLGVRVRLTPPNP